MKNNRRPLLKVSAALAVLGVTGGVAYSQHPLFGKRPQGERRLRFAGSPNYANGLFHNQIDSPLLTTDQSELSMWVENLFGEKGQAIRQAKARFFSARCRASMPDLQARCLLKDESQTKEMQNESQTTSSDDGGGCRRYGFPGFSRLAGSAAAQGNTAREGRERILVACFSWSGNTRGVARQIHRQTGGDFFEIEMAEPYSRDYNTCLDEALRDQRAQARPALGNHVENMAQYDVIFLGYPNWWASIPMPIASFLEEYDFAGKTITLFCSHGGGRLGQSVTAIAKLCPQAKLLEALSIHYSGGNSLENDVAEWLREIGMTGENVPAVG